MPIGIIINVIAVLLGTIIGGSIKKYVKDGIMKYVLNHKDEFKEW